jgi:hypothetical protein
MKSAPVFTAEAVERFADEAGTSPAVVVGRLRHEKLTPNSQLNELRRRIDAFLSEGI